MKLSTVTLVTRLLACGTVFFSLIGTAAELESCLTVAAKIEHRLNRTEAMLSCFEKNKKTIDSDTCFKGISLLKAKNFSTEQTEQVRANCFYEISRFKSISACLQKAKTFELAGSHDEAVFECYSQFQDDLNQKQCLTVSQLLRYPAKKEYLAEHCLTK